MNKTTLGAAIGRGDVDLRDLRLLLVLLEERSVSRAASRFGLSQPAASNALARLRAVFDDPLFVRSGRGIAPTPRALKMQPAIGRALAEIDGLWATRLRFDPASSNDTFTVAATDLGEFTLLPPLLSQLAEEAPGVNLRVVPLEAGFPIQELQTGTIDLLIGSFKTAPPRLYRQVLFTEGSVSLLRAGHPAANTKLSFEQFAALGHVLVGPRGETRGIIDEVLEQRGLRRRIVATVPHFLAAVFLVQATDLVVTVGERIAERFMAMLPLATAAAPMKFPRVTIAQLCHERNLRDPAHRWLRAKLAQVARAL